MSTPYLGEIKMFGFNFAPTGYAFCNGQLFPISQNTALFSLIGTFYGGNGTTNFQLPNLQGQVPLHMSSNFLLGSTGGEYNHTLITSEMPQHNHAMTVQNTSADTPVPNTGGSLLANSSVGMYAETTASTALNPASIASAGSGMPHNNQQPFLTLSFCIALQGIFPSRN